MSKGNKIRLALLGVLMIVIGGFGTGMWQRLLTGDTETYLRYGGGYIGSAIGLILIEYALLKGDS